MKRRTILFGLLAITLAGCNPFYSVEQSMVERGYRWVYRGKITYAIGTFESTIQKYPNSVLAHLGLADALFEARKDIEAVDSYTRAISLLDTAGSKPLGTVSGEKEVIGKRLLSYQNQGLTFPHGLEAYMYLRRGCAYESLAANGNRINHNYFSKAIADYDKVLQLAPRYEEAQKKRSQLLERANKNN